MSTEHKTRSRPPQDDGSDGAANSGQQVPVAADDLEKLRDVAVELRTLLGLRTRTSARDRPLPALTSLLAPSAQHDPDSRFAALTTLVEDGIEAMPEADHAAAAASLLGAGPGRWRPLSARGAEAALPFGCGWDAFRRRRRSTGTSLLEETVELLARAIVNLSESTGSSSLSAELPVAERSEEADQTPTVVIGPVTESDQADVAAGAAPSNGQHGSVDNDPRSRWTRPNLTALAAAAGATVVIFAGLAVLVGSLLSDRERPAAAACGSLNHEVGAIPAGADAGLIAWANAFETFVDSEGLTDLMPCATQISPWEHGAIQRVSDGDPSYISALVGSEVQGERVVVHLSWSELQAFGRTTDPNGPAGGSQLGETLGSVIGRDTGTGGERVVEFTDGLLVTEPTDAPTHAIAGAWVDIWNESGGVAGGLGLPLTDRRIDRTTGELSQQFERGAITTAADGQIQVAADQDHYAQALPDDPRNQVLVGEPGGFWWYVDGDGRRHFAATAADRTCLERRMGLPVRRNLPVAAIASLPAGEKFLCH